MILGSSILKEEFNRLSDSFSQHPPSQNDKIDKPSNLESALSILDKETNEFQSQSMTYFSILVVVFLVFFAIKAPSFAYWPAAVICALFLTPQLLKFHYRLRQYKKAEESHTEEQLKKIIYFADAHSKSIFSDSSVPTVIKKNIDFPSIKMHLESTLKKLETIKHKTIEITQNSSNGFDLQCETKSYFLSGRQKISASLKSNGDHYWLEISSYPIQRRRTLELGRNKINVLIIHEAILLLMIKLRFEKNEPRIFPAGIDTKKLTSFSPEHFPIPTDKVA